MLADVNITRVLRLLWQKKRISRGEIAAILHLDKSTVTKITSVLAAMNLIYEASEGTPGPQGGRKPVFIELVKTCACAGGIEINPERFSCTLLDLQGNVVFEHRQRIDPDDFVSKTCTGIFFEAYEILHKASSEISVPLAGIGVGLPAYINNRKGLIIQSIPLLIKEPLDFIQQIESKVSVPVYLENDARSCCYSELALKSDSWHENMLYVLVEYRPIQPVRDTPKNLSVGLGLVFNGEVFHGSDCSAGEFRSIFWREGNKSQFLNGEEQLVTMDDMSVVISVFEELAQNIAFLVNTLNIDRVYIGGLSGTYASKLVTIVRSRINYQWPYTNIRTIRVTAASLTENAVSFGAAGMVLEKLFQLPGLKPVEEVEDDKFQGKSILEFFNNTRTK